MIRADDQAQRIGKIPTDSARLAEVFFEGIRQAGVNTVDVDLLVHGSTVAINALLERKGAKTGLITTKGFRDVYEIRRQVYEDPSNMFYHKPVPLVPREGRAEVTERITSDGSVLVPLDLEELARAAATLQRWGARAIAVCFINAFRSNLHETQAAAHLRKLFPGLYIAASTEISREWREYERTATTVVNSYLAPYVTTFLRDLEAGLQTEGFGGRLFFTQSQGGLMEIDRAMSQPIHLLESGPAAGVRASETYARANNIPQLVAFDMGGTTAKASLVENGACATRSSYQVGGEPLLMPVLDIEEVSAGGSGIVWIDEGKRLRVGPESAGGHPGPVCYGRGGTRPTVTDANLVRGLLGPKSFLGGTMPLDLKAATKALTEEIADPLGLSVQETAAGVFEIANAIMLQALRRQTVQKGCDPRQAVLFAYGGAGPVHAVQLARELGIQTVVVPPSPGNFCAGAMLSLEILTQESRTVAAPLANAPWSDIVRSAQEFGKRTDSEIRTGLDLRWLGQEHTLRIELPDGWQDLSPQGLSAEIHSQFAERYRSRYGFLPQRAEVQVVTAHFVSNKGPATRAPEFTEPSVTSAIPIGTRMVFIRERGTQVPHSIYQRERLPVGCTISGPAIIEEFASTTVIGERDALKVETDGHLLIHTEKIV